MSDDSDDPVMALLATQRAVLAAVENLAVQVEAMQVKVDAMGETLAQLAASSTQSGADRQPSIGERFRTASAEEAAADPELRGAQGHYMVAQAIAKGLNKGDPQGAARDAAQARAWIADQLDQGRVFGPAKVRSGDNGTVAAVVEPIHEEMFPGRVRASHQPDRRR